MGYTGTFRGHKPRVLQAAAGFDQSEVTQGSLGLCRVWLCCIALGSPPARPKARSALAPAVQKSAQSVPSDASGVQVQHTKTTSSFQTTSSFPLATALAVCQPRHGQECWQREHGEELGLASSWGDGNTGKCWWERQRLIWYGFFRLLLLPLCICS